MARTYVEREEHVRNGVAWLDVSSNHLNNGLYKPLNSRYGHHRPKENEKNIANDHSNNKAPPQGSVEWPVYKMTIAIVNDNSRTQPNHQLGTALYFIINL
jgi:hypothetical protein